MVDARHPSRELPVPSAVAAVEVAPVQVDAHGHRLIVPINHQEVLHWDGLIRVELLPHVVTPEDVMCHKPELRAVIEDPGRVVAVQRYEGSPQDPTDRAVPRHIHLRATAPRVVHDEPAHEHLAQKCVQLQQCLGRTHGQGDSPVLELPGDSGVFGIHTDQPGKREFLHGFLQLLPHSRHRDAAAKLQAHQEGVRVRFHGLVDHEEPTVE
mmetsp:Transcript_16152/g.44424  ORF Transcript_16152/g.44424 Transcript_16152/m.44424 type:complete len:210 (-) Transcript_16152:566-1195(-)